MKNWNNRITHYVKIPLFLEKKWDRASWNMDLKLKCNSCKGRQAHVNTIVDACYPFFYVCWMISFVIIKSSSTTTRSSLFPMFKTFITWEEDEQIDDDFTMAKIILSRYSLRWHFYSLECQKHVIWTPQEITLGITLHTLNNHN